MTVLLAAADRAYRSPWTLMLIVFELMGASLIGLHSRTTVIWPFLLWLLCAPLVRLAYLRRLHRPAPSIGLWRTAYGIAAWLLVSGLLLATGLGALLVAIGHIRTILAVVGAATGIWGVVPATLALAALLIMALGAVLVWVAMVTVAYAAAAVDPPGGVGRACRQGLRAIAADPGVVIGTTTTQAVLAVAALGAQLFKHSGVTLMPLVWPAALFGPLVLALLLTRAESLAADRHLPS